MYKRDSKPTLKVKILCKKELSLPCQDTLLVSSLKREVCNRSSSLIESDLDVISSGKRLNDDDIVHRKGVASVFVIVRSQATSNVGLTVKEGSNTHRMQCPVNMRISELKRRLYNDNITTIKPADARMILNSRLVHDYSLVGDYLLGCRAAGMDVSQKSELKLYISRTLNLRAEVNVALELPNRQVLRFSIEVGDSLCYVQDILERQFGLTQDISTQLYLESGTPLSPSLSLFDYGVKPGHGVVKMNLRSPPSCPPCGSGPVAVPLVMHLPCSQGQSTTPTLVINTQSVQCPTQLKKRPSAPRDGRGGGSGPGEMFRGMKRGFLSAGKRTQRK